MNVFVAGGSGTIGVPLVRALVANGHHVCALTRSPEKQGALRALGASVAVADALNHEALMAAVESARPTHVIHQLTALPKAGPRRTSDIEATNRLRTEGTRNLLDAAIHAGARRFLVGSFALLADRSEGDGRPAAPAAAAVRSMESQVLDATKGGSIEGVVLRYGMFYGLETPSMVALVEMVRKRRVPVARGDRGQLPYIHIDDAVSATLLALDAAPAGAVYEIVDDRGASLAEVVDAVAEYSRSPRPLRVPGWLLRLVIPYRARLISVRMPLSNAQAKADLGWRPQYPTIRDGLAQMFRSTG